MRLDHGPVGEIRMKRFAFALFAMLPVAAFAQAAPLEVKDAWARATIGEAKVAAVYMTITSPGADRLVAASTPVAGKTDLMTMTGDSGAMEMIYLDVIEIPADTPVSLDATGLHVWLADLKRPLEAGETVPLRLTFEKAGPRQVMVAIVKPSATGPRPSTPR